MNKKIKVFDNTGDMAESFAASLFEEINKAAQNSMNFNIALSGGSTPKTIFQTLSTQYADKIKWGNACLYWGDERCVGPEDPDSNFGMTRKFLISNIQIPSENIHRIRGENDPEFEAAGYGLEIKDNVSMKNGWPSFDLIMLGLGEDGHTASIFPNQLELINSEKICAVAVHPLSGQKRITITGNVINNASRVIFLITGKKKAEIVKQIFSERAGNSNLPAALISPVNGTLDWYLDKEAAANSSLK